MKRGVWCMCMVCGCGERERKKGEGKEKGKKGKKREKREDAGSTCVVYRIVALLVASPPELKRIKRTEGEICNSSFLLFLSLF